MPSRTRRVWEAGNPKSEGSLKIEKAVKSEERVLGIKGGDRTSIESTMESAIIKLPKRLPLYCSKGSPSLEDQPKL